MKIKLKNYYLPTPKKIQKIADIIQTSCLTALGYSVIHSDKTLTLLMIGVMVAAKIVFQCFSDENEGDINNVKRKPRDND